MAKLGTWRVAWRRLAPAPMGRPANQVPPASCAQAHLPKTSTVMTSAPTVDPTPAPPAAHEPPHAGRRRPSPALVFIIAAGSVALAAGCGLFGAAEPTALFAIGLATLVGMVVSVWARRPSVIWPWIAIATALALFLVAGVERSSLHTLGDLTARRSLLPDVLALPGYVLLAAGLLGFSRHGIRTALRKSILVLDGLMAGLALAALAWAFVIEHVLLQQNSPLPVVLVLIAYPSLSVFMVVVTLRLALNPEQEPVPAFYLMLAGMVVMLIGDVLYMFVDSDLVNLPTRLVDMPYALAYVGAGATALHVSMRKLTQPGRARPSSSSRFRIFIVALALVIPALLTLVKQDGSAASRIVLSLLMLAMTIAAVFRIVQALYAAEHSEASLSYLANHDSLTGLPNRRMMEQHLSRVLERTRADASQVALLYLDLDRFKLINDTLGHSHGDELLIDVAARLRANVRPSDLVTRIGGDEFMVVLEQLVSVTQAVDLANRLRACLASPFVVNDMSFYVTTSIGLAFASGDDPEATTEALVRDADTAMYQAKDAGRDAVAVFDEAMRARMAERVELEQDLHFAVVRRQLRLVYQPIVSLPYGAVIGMEALVRWAHPRHGVISPAKFIPLAEESGLISEIGDWVLEEAVSQFASWRREYPRMAGLYMSVNLSAAQLFDAGIVDRVADVLAVHGLEGSALCLELTESVVMDDPAAAAATLGELRRLDVQIAIDDFGSEYSSLAYLKRFPATILKIDKAFVDQLGHEDSADATLVATIVAMARALNITTVAEGVETEVQARRLADLGCDTVQGYLYSRPLAADRLPEVVSSMSASRLQLVKAEG